MALKASKKASEKASEKASGSGKIIDAIYNEKNKSFGDFSLQNRQFIMTLYLSFFLALICFLFFAIRVPRVEKGEYIPAHIEEGKIVPARIISK